MLLERRNRAQHKLDLHAKLEGGDEWNINEIREPTGLMMTSL